MIQTSDKVHPIGSIEGANNIIQDNVNHSTKEIVSIV